MENLNIIPLLDWFDEFKEKPIIISGPCSAENETQLVETAKAISKSSRVKVLRAGIWKPRTRPNSFEGIGEEGLQWLKKAKNESGLLTTVEVTTIEDIDLCLKYDVDILWIGARSVANPINVKGLADHIEGIDIPVLVKNPMHPDLEHWIGALERFNKAGIKRLAAVHRGFYPFEQTKLRNIPKWEIPIELKRRFPDLPIFCDPSHIAGDASLVQEVAQKALNLNMDGLMIEAHINPKVALSDAQQQLDPNQLNDLLYGLKYSNYLNGSFYDDKLETMREQLDSIDQQMLELLGQRMDIVREIGAYKCENNMTVFQLRRWQKSFNTNVGLGEKLKLNKDFIHKLTSLIHLESIQEQNEVISKMNCNKKNL